MNFFLFITQDFEGAAWKSKFITFCFRIANYSYYSNWKYFFYPYNLLYRIVFEWILGIEIRYNTKIGSGLKIYHFQSIVINTNAVIGKNLSLRHCTTIGNNGYEIASPIIGDNVDIGSNVCIIGNISIGDNVTIGAGSVVVKDVPANCIVVGNPGRILRYKDVIVS